VCVYACRWSETRQKLSRWSSRCRCSTDARLIHSTSTSLCHRRAAGLAAVQWQRSASPCPVILILWLWALWAARALVFVQLVRLDFVNIFCACFLCYVGFCFSVIAKRSELFLKWRVLFQVGHETNSINQLRSMFTLKYYKICFGITESIIANLAHIIISVCVKPVVQKSCCHGHVTPSISWSLSLHSDKMGLQLCAAVILVSSNFHKYALRIYIVIFVFLGFCLIMKFSGSCGKNCRACNLNREDAIDRSRCRQLIQDGRWSW